MFKSKNESKQGMIIEHKPKRLADSVNAVLADREEQEQLTKELFGPLIQAFLGSDLFSGSIPKPKIEYVTLPKRSLVTRKYREKSGFDIKWQDKDGARHLMCFILDPATRKITAYFGARVFDRGKTVKHDDQGRWEQVMNKAIKRAIQQRKTNVMSYFV